jgi:serine/threonine protein kinase
MAETDRIRSALGERYEIERELGSGGMATVYLARDIKHDREVALKVLRSDLSAVIGTERFLGEVRITARLDHPHILTLIDSGEADGILYYVLPYVRGESLRAKLEREKQLGIDESLSITKQIASALDYAHSHGVVHRDIKPENILLHEGEAVLADFGIALAVKEAGGNRLTETGLSLGTPQYMSPEQATGDRALDKRSDVYSLGAVYYEMITGEPPVTGATAQAMIAKLLTEKPVKMRVIRPTISHSMEIATEKALAKIPADRFSSAGEFVRALSVAEVEEKEIVAKTSKGGNTKWIIGGIAAALVIGWGVYMAGHGSAEAPRSPVSLRDRVQLTNTGNAREPAISDDGKMLAYVVTTCGKSGCRYAIDVKDAGGTETRRLLDGATAIYGTEISPDRRNLLFLGSMNEKFGTYLVSLVNGTPRFISTSSATFYAGGDSLLVSPVEKSASGWKMLVAGLDGVAVDSVPVDVAANDFPFFTAVPGSSRIIVTSRNDGVTTFTAITRQGETLSFKSLPRGATGAWSVSRDALWLDLAMPGRGVPQIVRIPFDSATMKFDQKGDTVYTGSPSGFEVTGDGGTLVLDEGSADYSVWTLSVDDIINDRFKDENRVLRATGGLHGAMSPDGRISTIGRDASGGGVSWSVIAAGSTAEIPIPGRHNSAVPLDSLTIKLSDISEKGTSLYLYNIRTRGKSAQLNISDASPEDFTRLGNDSWVWIPSGGKSIRIQRDGESSSREVKLPSWYKIAFWVSGAKDGGKIVFTGWQYPNEDSIGVGIFNVADNSFTRPFSKFAENATATWLNDGGLYITIGDTQESVSFYRMTPDGKVTKLGSTPRIVDQATSITASSDMKRAFLISRDDRRDVWMSKVVR